MGHFGSEAWADLARGAADPEQAALLRAHLAEDCRRCSRLFRVWEQVSALAKREISYEPPESAVAEAKQLHRSHRQAPLVPEHAELAQLIYDSFDEPLPAGIRASGDRTRHMLYRAGSFVVDLHFETEPESTRVSVVGQVLHQAHPPEGVSNIPVLLVGADNEWTGNTTTNEFGEFHLEFDAKRRHRLALVVNEKRAVVIPSSHLRSRRQYPPVEEPKTPRAKRPRGVQS